MLFQHIGWRIQGFYGIARSENQQEAIMGINARQKLDVNAFNERFNRTLQEDFVEYKKELLAEDLRLFNCQTHYQMTVQQLPGLSHMWWPHTRCCFK